MSRYGLLPTYIAIANQKGGTGKTTTTVNLGVGLARAGNRVLLVDADPQGDLTTSLGFTDQDNLPVTLTTHMESIIRDRPMDAREGILHHEEGVDLIPANIELSGMEMMLVNAMSRETTLKTCLEPLKKQYDYIVIDCMPSLGMLTINTLAAADSVIVAVQAHYLPLKGMTQLVQTIKKVQRQIKGKRTHRVALGTDIYGNITRLDNEIEKFSDNLSRCRERLETLKAQLETAKVEAVKEFPQEQELAEKTVRLGELNALLDVGKSDKVMLDEEPDGGMEEPETRSKDVMER